jgi:dTMP kinase
MSHHPFKPRARRGEQFPGAFITLEGPDGSGKTTNVDYLAEQVRQLGYDVILTREPGGSDIGEDIRTLVINKRMPAMAELLLMYASRADHVEELIKPALRQGKIVISDRFSDSTFAYQGHGRGLREETLAIEEIVLKGFEPDWTLYFDVSLGTSLSRLAARSGKSDRFDTEDVAFRQKLYNGYQERFAMHLARMYSIDAELTPEEVRDQVRRFTRSCFQGWIQHRNADWVRS